MGIEVPTAVRVYSKDFRELFIEVCTEVNRLASLYQDISRLRAIVDRSGGGGAETQELLFFEVSGGNGNVTTNGDFQVKTYVGTVFTVSFVEGELRRSVIAEGATAYDLSVEENVPQKHPATTLIADPLASGTVVQCVDINGGYVFASIMPRFSVVC
jgi:hypothetical protein